MPKVPGSGYHLPVLMKPVLDTLSVRGDGIYIDFRGKLQRQAVSQAYQRCLRGIIIQSHWIIGIDAIG